MIISFFGLGKAGLPFACVIAKAGHTVVGVDIDRNLVDSINRGIANIDEPGVTNLVKRLVSEKKLSATLNGQYAVKHAAAHIVLVPLFLDENNDPNYGPLTNALTTIAQGLKRNDLVVIETTLPPGTMNDVVIQILENSKLRAGVDFHLAYSPERTMSGFALSRYSEFPKIVSGVNEQSTRVVKKLYDGFSNVMVVSSPKVAEFVKVFEGIYRDVNVALANELYKVCEKAGVDFWEVRSAANHTFCNIHEAGNGTGGHCIPVYPWFIIKKFDAQITKLARDVNDSMASYFASIVMKGNNKKTTVAIVGLTYREGVKATYNSRAFALIEELKKKHAIVVGYDSLLSGQEIRAEFDISQVKDFSSVDKIIVLTKDNCYRKLLKPYINKVLDTKNIFG
ncbi:MAG: nucleotide sugar dehydrogenase [Nanoarchaeota archaeon]